jgi:hypothetical protein
MEGSMKHMHAFAATVLVVVLLGACGPSTTAPTAAPTVPATTAPTALRSMPSTALPTAVPTVSTMAIPFVVCGESTTWTRPAEAEQKAKQWNSGRYASADQKLMRYPWAHNFLVSYGSASADFDLINLSGLWTLGADIRAGCLEPVAQDAVLKLQTAEVWVLLHRVKEVRRAGAVYTIVVTPVDRGVQFVRFARPEQQVPLTFTFVDDNGREVDQIVEAESPYWPYPDLLPTGSP